MYINTPYISIPILLACTYVIFPNPIAILNLHVAVYPVIKLHIVKILQAKKKVKKRRKSTCKNRICAAHTRGLQMSLLSGSCKNRPL